MSCLGESFVHVDDRVQLRKLDCVDLLLCAECGDCYERISVSWTKVTWSSSRSVSSPLVAVGVRSQSSTVFIGPVAWRFEFVVAFAVG